MAALIKNALIKQLSKFLKNVSANQINISTFKGEGEMKNIELDENVLMELIELPTWLRITSARCNKASVKIAWTKLKTNPIVILLDKIELDMEIADPLREYTTAKDGKLFQESTGGYGFIDRCIDAIQLNIDSITITIKSTKFNANLNMSNIYVYSTTPNWKITPDIRNTKLKDLEKEEIILFKEISWEICRLEAYNIDPSIDLQQTTSIRLIMNPSKVQIALKKKLSDKSLICSTFRVLLNEIYWMANDTQLKSAFGTYNTLSKLMKKAFIQKRKYAQYQENTQNKAKPNPTRQQAPRSPSTSSVPPQPTIDISKVFRQYDIKETSLHLQISNLNIHMYADDNYSGNKMIDGGALQVLFKDLCIDHYPYHRIGSSIKHWHNYNHTFKQREEWSKTLVVNDINKIKLKNNINLLEACTICTLKDLCVYKVTTNMSNMAATKSKRFASANQTKVKESSSLTPNELLRTKKFFIEQQMYNSRQFISSNFAEFSLPNDTLFAHFFFSDFYFPEDVNYPVPCPQLFAQISPVLVNIDFLTLLWLNTLMLSLYKEKLIADKDKKMEYNSSLSSFENKPVSKNLKQNTKFVDISKMDNNNNKEDDRPSIHCDTYLEFIMPKISLTIYPKTSMFDSASFTQESFKRPSGIEIGFARICVTNQNIPNSSSSLSSSKSITLKSTCEKAYESSKLLCKKYSNLNANESLSAEPSVNHHANTHQNEMKVKALAPCFNDYTKNENLPYMRYDLSFDDDLTKLINTTNEAFNPKVGLFLKSLNKSALNKNANKDLWTIDFESMWIDFCDSINTRTGSTENSSLIQNTSFKLFLVSVWDFFKSTPNIGEQSSTPKKDSLIVEEMVQQDGLIDNQDNVQRAFRRLDNNVIKINEAISNESRESRIIETPNKRKGVKQKRSNSLSAPSKLVKNQENSHYLCRELYSKINVIGHINELYVKIDHSKILFLLRLLDTVDLFTQQLKEDGEQTLKYKTGKVEDKTRKVLDKKFREEKEKEEDEDEASVNLSFIINTIEVELFINDHSKEKKIGKKQDTDLNKTDDIHKDLNMTDLSSINVSKEEQLSNSLSHKKDDQISVRSMRADSTPLLIINDPMAAYENIKKEDFDQISKQLDREFMISYLKFIYGLSSENPTLKHSFITVSNVTNDDHHSNTLNASHSNLTSNLNSNPTMSASFSTNNSSISLISSNRSLSISSASGTNPLALFKNTLTTATNAIKKDISPQNESIDPDFFDDNDNYAVILSLEQDDTSSLTSYTIDLPNNQQQLQAAEMIKPNPSSVSLSSSSSSSFSNSKSSTLPLSDMQQSKASTQNQPSPMNKTFSEMHVQTSQPETVIKIKLNSLKMYVQQFNTDLCALVSLDEVELQNKKSKLNDNINKDKNNNNDKLINENKSLSSMVSIEEKLKRNFDLLVCFKKIENDIECQNGLLKLIIENLAFEVDIPTLVGILELVEDDDFHEPDKKTLPINILIKNCHFSVNDNPNDADCKSISLSINDLIVNKLENNEIVITEMNLSNMDKKLFNFKKSILNYGKSPRSMRKLRRKSLSKEIEYDSQFKLFKNDSIESFNYKSKFDNRNSNQLASLIYLLRKSKEDNHKIWAKLDQERLKAEQFRLENKLISTKLKQIEIENEEFKKLASKNENTSDQEIKIKEKEEKENIDGFILSDKKEVEQDMAEKFEQEREKFKLERNQFESLLKMYKEENEILKIKLEKSENNFIILNSERDSLIRKLNGQVKTS